MTRSRMRFLLFLLLLDLLLAGQAAPSRVRKLTEDTWTVRLVVGCELDYHTPIGAAALACPGVDYMMRLWPLPVVQPWQETPDPVRGWMAERLKPVGAGTAYQRGATLAAAESSYQRVAISVYRQYYVPT